MKQNNKLFDEGEGFKFRVGKGEVIKGWDVGLDGMKVGGKSLPIILDYWVFVLRIVLMGLFQTNSLFKLGKRKLVIPAHMA